MGNMSWWGRQETIDQLAPVRPNFWLSRSLVFGHWESNPMVNTWWFDGKMPMGPETHVFRYLITSLGLVYVFVVSFVKHVCDHALGGSSQDISWFPCGNLDEWYLVEAHAPKARRCGEDGTRWFENDFASRVSYVFLSFLHELLLTYPWSESGFCAFNVPREILVAKLAVDDEHEIDD